MLTERASGILLHPTSLPGPYGIGDFGAEARAFIDFLQQSGQKVWQLLPLGPTGYGDSPYSSFSAFAGNPLLLSLPELVTAGDLQPEEIIPPPFPTTVTDFGAVRTFKMGKLKRAAESFFLTATGERRAGYERFCTKSAYWLDDYTLYMAIRRDQGDRPWIEWPAGLRDREPESIAMIRQKLKNEINLENYIQFNFAHQWQGIKGYANDQGVRIFGDLPIFVADDSADVWAHRDIFQLDGEGHPLRVAGVPPDYFSATGQRWGNPLYDWQRLQKDGFSWWIERLRQNLDLYDLIRIDHFRGFSACWSIPAREPTAIHGEWEDVPGQDFFTAATNALGPLPVIAEDLGFITPEVEELRDHFGFPGMKVLHFAFGGGDDNPYLPYKYHDNSVVYTGTHDNDTTIGWWHHLGEEERQRITRYVGRTIDNPVVELLRLAHSSVSRLSILPIQDLLQLDSTARFNRPGAPTGNWQWRWDTKNFTANLAETLRDLTSTYGR